MSGRIQGTEGDRHKVEDRAETRLDENLGSRLADYRDANGMTKSEVVREALDEYLPTAEESEYVVPQDPKLRDAYLALAGDRKRRLNVPHVVSILSEESHPNTAKNLIKSEVLPALEEGGFIGVGFGTVAVHPLTEKGELLDEVEP
jgi:predicted DNA-binding protein